MLDHLGEGNCKSKLLRDRVESIFAARHVDVSHGRLRTQGLVIRGHLRALCCDSDRVIGVRSCRNYPESILRLFFTLRVIFSLQGYFWRPSGKKKKKKTKKTLKQASH